VHRRFVGIGLKVSTVNLCLHGRDCFAFRLTVDRSTAVVATIVRVDYGLAVAKMESWIEE
jgi:hypothetical protein